MLSALWPSCLSCGALVLLSCTVWVAVGMAAQHCLRRPATGRQGALHCDLGWLTKELSQSSSYGKPGRSAAPAMHMTGSMSL